MKKLVFTFLISLFFLPHFAHADITTGLIAWYKLNDGSGTSALDSSGNNNTAVNTGSGSAVTWTTGNIGPTAAYCHGGQGFAAPHLAAYNSSAITNSYWVKFDDISNVYRVDEKNGDWIFRTAGAGMQFIDAIVFNSNASNSTGWDMWTFTGDGTNYKLYKNGVLDASQAQAFPTPSNNADFLICPGINTLAGALEDVRIYNRALTQADVTELYAYREGSPTTASFIPKLMLWGKMIINGFLKI